MKFTASALSHSSNDTSLILRARLDAGVVHQQMQLAELALDLLEHLRPAVAIGDVVLDRQDAGVAFLEQRQRGFQALLVAIADAHLHARRCEAARAMPSPMPSEDAVTYATLPFRSCSGAGCETLGSGGWRGRAGGRARQAGGVLVCADGVATQTEPGEDARRARAVRASFGEKAAALPGKAIHAGRRLGSVLLGHTRLSVCGARLRRRRASPDARPRRSMPAVRRPPSADLLRDRGEACGRAR